MNQPELRNVETIRAYLEELVRAKRPMQFWIPQPGAVPFETTLERVEREVFSITTTPVLEVGQVLHLAFMLDFRRFISQTQVLGPGTFRLPASIRHGESQRG